MPQPVADIDHDRPFAAVFEERAQTFADRPAVVAADGDVTFAELDALANRVAAEIDRACAAPGGAVATLLGNGTTFVAAMLAVLKTGRFYVPLNEATPASTNGGILARVEAPLLLTDGTRLAAARGIAGDGCAVFDLDAPAPGLAAGNPPPPRQELGAVFFTSGTTGEPKGVMQTQRNLLYNCDIAITTYDVRPGDRVMWTYHNSTSASVMNMFAPLLSGATVCAFDLHAYGAAAMADFIDTQGITHMFPFRTAFHQCVTAIAPERRFASVRQLILSSEPAYDSDIEAWRRHFPAVARLVNQLGTTEAGVFRRYFIGRDDPVPPGAMPLGHAIDDKEVLLWDDDGAEVAAGEVGEIIVRSHYLTRGYWRDPEQTARSFLTSADGVPMFRTGDLGRIDADGCLHSMGRKDNQVKILGKRVELAAVEAALLGLAEIDEAAVVARVAGGGHAA